MNGFKNSERLKTIESSERRGEVTQSAAEKINEFERTLFSAAQKLESLREAANSNLKKKIDKTLKKIDITLALAKGMKNIAAKNVGERVEKFVQGQAGFMRRLEKQLDAFAEMITLNNKAKELDQKLNSSRDFAKDDITDIGKENVNEAETDLQLNFDENAGKELNALLKNLGASIDFNQPEYSKDTTVYKFFEEYGKREPGLVRKIATGELAISLANSGKSLNIQLKRNEGGSLFDGQFAINDNLSKKVFESIASFYRQEFIREMESTNYNVQGGKYFIGRKINVNNGGVYPIVKKLDGGGTVDFAALQVANKANGIEISILDKSTDYKITRQYPNEEILYANYLSDGVSNLISDFMKGKSL